MARILCISRDFPAESRDSVRREGARGIVSHAVQTLQVVARTFRADSQVFFIAESVRLRAPPFARRGVRPGWVARRLRSILRRSRVPGASLPVGAAPIDPERFPARFVRVRSPRPITVSDNLSLGKCFLRESFP